MNSKPYVKLGPSRTGEGPAMAPAKFSTWGFTLAPDSQFFLRFCHLFCHARDIPQLWGVVGFLERLVCVDRHEPG